MNPIRRHYVRSFIRSQGYNPHDLGDDRLLELFILLARVEEYATLQKHNQHNWELCYAPSSRQAEHRFPIIDIKLRQWARDGRIIILPDVPTLWPQGKKFALCLTHDVDIVSGNLWKERFRSLPFYRNAPATQKYIVVLSLLREIARLAQFWKTSPEHSLDVWLDSEEKYGFRSSFFFLADPVPKPSWEDTFYCYRDRITLEGRRLRLAEVMKEIARRGWDVGLHGASYSSMNYEYLRQEKHQIERAIGGTVFTIRQHHLLFDMRYTPFFQEEAGFQADSTLGTNINIGFRVGTSFPFFLYDLHQDRSLNVLEVPLIIQEVALFRHMGLSEQMAVEQSLEMMEQVAKVNGVLTLLWHNNYKQNSLEFAVYNKLLAEAENMGAWGCSVRDMNDWWRARFIKINGSIANDVYSNAHSEI